MRHVKLVTAAAVIALAAGCARQLDTTGTTTITSGTPGGARVTSARPGDDRVALRIADEMCRREAACNTIGDGSGMRYRSEEACMADHGAMAPEVVGRWTCRPDDGSATFEECLASIRSERCETRLDRADRLRACRGAAVCAARGER